MFLYRAGWLILTEVQKGRRTFGLFWRKPNASPTYVKTLKREMTFCAPSVRSRDSQQDWLNFAECNYRPYMWLTSFHFKNIRYVLSALKTLMSVCHVYRMLCLWSAHVENSVHDTLLSWSLVGLCDQDYTIGLTLSLCIFTVSFTNVMVFDEGV